MKVMTDLASRAGREDRPSIVVRGDVGGKCVGLTGALAATFTAAACSVDSSTGLEPPQLPDAYLGFAS